MNNPLYRQTLARKYTRLIEKYGEKPTNFDFGGGSGDTLVLIYPSFVAKFFPSYVRIRDIVERRDRIDSKYLVKIIDFIEKPNVILYEKLKPLKKIEKASLNDLISQICCIANALHDIHSAGFVHGDVAIGNIGINDQGKYILFDLETLKEDDSAQARFDDVEMFLVDFCIQYKEYPELRLFIEMILKTLRKEHTKERKTITEFLGKKRVRTYYEYTYDVKDFCALINEHCVKIGFF